MLASILNKLITIEKESTSTNAVGTPEETYVFYKQAYANKIPASGDKQYNNIGEIVFTTDSFIVRYDKGINYKCRLIYNNNYYKIEHIEELGRRQWLKLKVIVWERSQVYG